MTATSAYRVVLEPHRDGIWTAEIPAMRIVTEGRGKNGALRAASKAIAGFIKVARKRKITVPPPDALAIPNRRVS